jgi:hypothetical protein
VITVGIVPKKNPEIHSRTDRVSNTTPLPNGNGVIMMAVPMRPSKIPVPVFWRAGGDFRGRCPRKSYKRPRVSRRAALFISPMKTELFISEILWSVQVPKEGPFLKMDLY